jgi:uridine kinase
MNKAIIENNNTKQYLTPIFNSPLFWIGLILKIFLASFFASKFSSELFINFIDYFSKSNFSDPYRHFFNENKLNIFPYPSLMLYILSPIYHLANFEIINLKLLALRIPIIFADFLLLIVIFSWLKKDLNKLLIFYWLSPVLIYINYIHGQLDAIPISLLFLALFYLFKEQLFLAFLFISLALACKTNIFLAIPFFIIYLFSRNISPKKIILLTLSIPVIFITINLNYIYKFEFLKMVLINQEQNKIFDLSFTFSKDLVFYFIPASYLILLIKAWFIKNLNRDIFLMFLGFSFGVLNLFIPPMQGWYYWIIPFFIYFFIKDKNSPSILFFILQFAYLAYFAVNKKSDYFTVFEFINSDIAKLNNFYDSFKDQFGVDKIVNIFFTILQVILGVVCFWIYRKGIFSYQKHKITCKPYLIGISGNSGVGKTTLVENLSNIFGKNNLLSLCGDDSHRWERGHKKWQEYTHLNPKANQLHQEISFLTALKNGQKIQRKTYNHDNGKFDNLQIFKANKIIVLEGLHSFFVSSVRNLFDLKIFIKPNLKLQLHWKIIRDNQKRTYSKEQILEIINQRKEDYEKFILPQEQYANIVLEISPADEISDIGNPNLQIDLVFNFIFENKINIDDLLGYLDKISTLKINHQYQENDRQKLEVKGEITSTEVNQIFDNLLADEFSELNFSLPQFSENLQGIVQLILAFYIIKSEINDL